jgi:putative transposase
MDQHRLRKTFTYKLQPTAAQKRELERVLGLCRQLYNGALQQRITAWVRRRVSVTRYEQEAELKDIRAEFPEYAAIPSHVLQDVLARLNRTYQVFFRRAQREQKAGFPRFKGRDRFHSFTLKEVGNGARLDHGVLVLSKSGRIAVRWSRPLAGTPKTVTASREADGWYVAISGAEVPRRALPLTGEQTGIDLGVESFATLADGTQVANPRPRIFRVAERHLRRAQRRVFRRVKGSHRLRKAVRLLARAHQRPRRTRANFHHRTARSLVRRHDTIYHEDLRPANMLKHHHLAKSIVDAGWSAFLSILSCPAVEAGKTVVAVPQAFTSHAYSGCGVLVHKGLSIRWRAYPDCGASLQRDHNAARTIPAWGTEQRRDSGEWGRAGPSGANVARRGERSLRIRRARARAECQEIRIAV